MNVKKLIAVAVVGVLAFALLKKKKKQQPEQPATPQPTSQAEYKPLENVKPLPENPTREQVEQYTRDVAQDACNYAQHLVKTQAGQGAK